LLESNFDRIFTAYGPPGVIWDDNGAAFDSTGTCRLTQLNGWWVQLGNRVEFIEPGRPDQNAVHDRMHRTLKDETCCPPNEPTTPKSGASMSGTMCLTMSDPPGAEDALSD
jgi:hypothetical protein